MTTEPTQTVRVVRRFTAPAELVFDAWLDADKASKWLFSTPTGTMVRAETDARVGGSFIFVDRRDGEDIEHVGEYIEIDRPRRLVFDFRVPKFSSVSTRITIDIEPLGAQCRLTLTHKGVLDEYAQRTTQGWTKILEGLGGSVEGGPATYGEIIAKDTVRFQRLLPGPIELVWSCLADSDRREKWFASGEIEPRVGGKATLTFNHNGLSPLKADPPERFKSMQESITFEQEVTVYEPPHKLGLTWGEDDFVSDVLFELTEKDDKVLLTITHSALNNTEEMMQVSGGWHSHLAILTEVLEGRTPPAFWTLFGDIEEEYGRRYAAEDLA